MTQFRGPPTAGLKQLESKPALGARVVTESPKEAKTCLSFDAEVCLLDGSWRLVKALVDSGSELNFVAQLLVKEAGWAESEEVVQAIRMLDGRTMPVYSIHSVFT